MIGMLLFEYFMLMVWIWLMKLIHSLAFKPDLPFTGPLENGLIA